MALSMNPYFFAAIMKAVRERRRECPSCRRVQVVSSERKDRTVRCKFCGAEIPPERTNR